MITSNFAHNVAKLIFDNVDLPPHVRQIHVNNVPTGEPAASLGDSGILYVNVSQESCGSPLLLDAVRRAVQQSQ